MLVFSVNRLKSTALSDIMTMEKVELTTHNDHEILSAFLPIYMHSLRLESILDFDIYIYTGDRMVLFRASHLPFTEKVRENLIERDVKRLYISREHRRQYQKYIESNINNILDDPHVDAFTKVSIIYDSAKELLKDVFADPVKGENIRRSQDLVESTVMYILGGQNALHNMLRVMSFDYSVYTHSVNVCTFALALASASGIEKSQKLIELGTGAILHDIGKVKIPGEILYKAGPLNQSEMNQIREHPQWGVELVSETDLIPPASYIPIKQHHERQNGSGYPDHLQGDDIHPFGKIVAIADAFDAMTTQRIYRGAKTSFSALKTMFDYELGYDPHLLEIFTRLMGPGR